MTPDRPRPLVDAASIDNRVAELAARISQDHAATDELQPEYVGFPIDDVWVVGYGLDHAGRYRSLPYVGVLDGVG